MIEVVMKKHGLPISMGEVKTVSEEEASILVATGRAVYMAHTPKGLSMPAAEELDWYDYSPVEAESDAELLDADFEEEK